MSICIAMLMTQKVLINIKHSISYQGINTTQLHSVFIRNYLLFTHKGLLPYAYKTAEFTCTQCGRMEWTLATQDVHSCATFLQRKLINVKSTLKPQQKRISAHAIQILFTGNWGLGKFNARMRKRSLKGANLQAAAQFSWLKT